MKTASYMGLESKSKSVCTSSFRKYMVCVWICGPIYTLVEHLLGRALGSEFELEGGMDTALCK